MTSGRRPLPTGFDGREDPVRDEWSTGRHPPAGCLAPRWTDGGTPSKWRAIAPPLAPAERRASLMAAAVLIEEALRLLDQGGSSITGVWLSHAAECLEAQLYAMP